MQNFTSWEQKAKLLRKLSLTSTSAAGSGHPTSCLSAADLMAALFDSYFSYDLANPLNLTNDRLLFSKGHASPLFYALYAVAGAIPLEESQETMFGHHVEEYQRRFSAFGFETIVIDGHNFEEIKQAFDRTTTNSSEKPFAVIAKTHKGQSISFLQDADNWHGKALKKE